MAYRINGLDPLQFAPLVQASDADLASHAAMRVVADSDPGFPCRVSLEDAAVGETLLLLQHVSHDVATPFRSSYAIYVRARALIAACYEDSIPLALDRRTVALRAFGSNAMLYMADLAVPGELDGKIRTLFEDPQVAYIHAHYAAPGCFAATIQKYGT